MASDFYDSALNMFAKGDILWKASGGSTIRCCLVKTAYTPSMSTHDFLDDLGDNVVGNGGSATYTDCPTVALTDAASGGCCDASTATTVITSVPGSEGECSYICLFVSGTGAGDSALICLIDITPFTPDGNNVVITWDTSPDYIFKIGST